MTTDANVPILYNMGLVIVDGIQSFYVDFIDEMEIWEFIL